MRNFHHSTSRSFRFGRVPNHGPRRIQDLDPRRLIQAHHRIPSPIRVARPLRRAVVIRHQVPVALERQGAFVRVAAALREGVAAGPDGVEIGRVEDDDVVVALILRDDALEVRKGTLVGCDVELVFLKGDGTRQGQGRAQEIGGVGGRGDEVRLELLSAGHARGIVHEVGVVVEELLDRSGAAAGVGEARLGGWDPGDVVAGDLGCSCQVLI